MMNEPYEARHANLTDCPKCAGHIYYFDSAGIERACWYCLEQITTIRESVPESAEVVATKKARRTVEDPGPVWLAIIVLCFVVWALVVYVVTGVLR